MFESPAPCHRSDLKSGHHSWLHGSEPTETQAQAKHATVSKLALDILQSSWNLHANARQRTAVRASLGDHVNRDIGRMSLTKMAHGTTLHATDTTSTVTIHYKILLCCSRQFLTWSNYTQRPGLSTSAISRAIASLKNTSNTRRSCHLAPDTTSPSTCTTDLAHIYFGHLDRTQTWSW